MLGIDTCSWLKLDLLAKSGWESTITMVFNEFELFTTHEVVEEFEHYLPHRKDWLKKIIIRPRDEKTYPQFVGDIFDPADASLLSLAQDPAVLIITEDPAILAENVYLQKNIIQFIDLLVLLFQNQQITKKEFYQLIDFFRKKRNITKRKESKLKE